MKREGIRYVQGEYYQKKKKLARVNQNGLGKPSDSPLMVTKLIFMLHK
jgi:hypothetical protein